MISRCKDEEHYASYYVVSHLDNGFSFYICHNVLPELLDPE